MRKRFTESQLYPLTLTAFTFLILCLTLYLTILILNIATKDQVLLKVRISDVLVGITIYLKTSIDFAIFIGNLMHKNTGIKNRIAIEVGTAIGNGLGTIGVFILWDLLREINWLLAIMIVLAALVLLEMAQDGLLHAFSETKSKSFKKIISNTSFFLEFLTRLTSPILSKIMPHRNLSSQKSLPWKKLFFFAMTIPFILGLDDFAGYVPLFNIVNIFGFAIGVFLGHMTLNILMFASPKKTIALVKNSVISYLGALAFVGLSFWGIWEAGKLIFGH